MASGETRDPDVMVRYVLSPDGEVVADVFGKLPGRGVWVSADEASLRKAVKTGGFARGLKAKVKPDADALMVQTRDGLRRQMLRHLTMARKAGRLAFGEVGVREAAARGDVALRIEASDGADKGRGKLRTLSLATARELDRPDPLAIGAFSAAEIGEALGREPVVHAAILFGPVVAQIKQAAQRLAGFTPLIPADWPDAKHEPSWPDRKGPEARSGPS